MLLERIIMEIEKKLYLSNMSSIKTSRIIIPFLIMMLVLITIVIALLLLSIYYRNYFEIVPIYANDIVTSEYNYNKD
jgi:hypothetical protein